jgi:hypothetical protein
MMDSSDVTLTHPAFLQVATSLMPRVPRFYVEKGRVVASTLI